MKSSRTRLASAAIAAAVFIPLQSATAGITTWTINSSQSSVSMAIPQQTITVDVLGVPTNVTLRAATNWETAPGR